MFIWPTTIYDLNCWPKSWTCHVTRWSGCPAKRLGDRVVEWGSCLTCASCTHSNNPGDTMYNTLGPVWSTVPRKINVKTVVLRSSIWRVLLEQRKPETNLATSYFIKGWMIDDDSFSDVQVPVTDRFEVPEQDTSNLVNQPIWPDMFWILTISDHVPTDPLVGILGKLHFCIPGACSHKDQAGQSSHAWPKV